MEEQKKPDWITDEQWKANPNVSWWEHSKACGEYIAKQKPVSLQEAIEQFERLRNEKNWNQG